MNIVCLCLGDNHVLNIRLVDHLFDDMLVEEAEIRNENIYINIGGRRL